MISKNRYSVLATEMTKRNSFAAILSSDGANSCIENIYNYRGNDSFEDLKDQINRGYAIVGEELGSFFHITPRSRTNLEIHKAIHGVTDGHYYDYMDFDERGVLIAITKDEASEVLDKASVTFPSIPEFLLGNSLLALFWGYCRSYTPSIDDHTFLFHVRSECLSAILAHGETPIWSGSLTVSEKIDRDEWIIRINQLIKAAHEDLTKLASSNEFDRVILSGDFENSDCISLSKIFKDKGKAIGVELFKLNHAIFEFGNNIGVAKHDVEKTFHRYAIAIFAASMLCEHTGIHTGEEYPQIYREYFKERLNFKQESVFSKLGTFVGGLKTYTPLLLGQSTFVGCAILFSLVIGGYRFWDNYNVNLHLDSQISQEQKRAETFVEVRTKVDSYHQQIQLINQRIALIDDISKGQMLVRTIALELGNRVPPGLKFSDVSIKGRDIRIKGYAPDRSAVMRFANDIGTSIGMFSSVNPIYDDKSDKGDYEISCQYTGNIPIYKSPVNEKLAEYRTKATVK